MTATTQSQNQPSRGYSRSEDPILADLWAMKREMNEAAGYDLKKLLADANEAVREWQTKWPLKKMVLTA